MDTKALIKEEGFSAFMATVLEEAHEESSDLMFNYLKNRSELIDIPMNLFTNEQLYNQDQKYTKKQFTGGKIEEEQDDLENSQDEKEKKRIFEKKCVDSVLSVIFNDPNKMFDEIFNFKVLSPGIVLAKSWIPHFVRLPNSSENSQDPKDSLFSDPESVKFALHQFLETMSTLSNSFTQKKPSKQEKGQQKQPEESPTAIFPNFPEIEKFFESQNSKFFKLYKDMEEFKEKMKTFYNDPNPVKMSNDDYKQLTSLHNRQQALECEKGFFLFFYFSLLMKSTFLLQIGLDNVRKHLKIEQNNSIEQIYAPLFKNPEKNPENTKKLQKMMKNFNPGEIEHNSFSSTVFGSWKVTIPLISKYLFVISKKQKNSEEEAFENEEMNKKTSKYKLSAAEKENIQLKKRRIEEETKNDKIAKKNEILAQEQQMEKENEENSGEKDKEILKTNKKDINSKMNSLSLLPDVLSSQGAAHGKPEPSKEDFENVQKKMMNMILELNKLLLSEELL